MAWRIAPARWEGHLIMAVTPGPGLVSQITTGGTPVIPIPGNPNGGVITNPYTSADQGIANVEPLYINPVNSAGLTGNGSTFALLPGASWIVIPGQTTPTSVNAATPGHKFSVVFW